MAMVDVTAPQLSKSQTARRERVVVAALELGAEGGYEAVQMRDVAARANVALGTIYRYFSSKDHLLAAAMVEWCRDLERRVGLRPPRGATTADRVIDILGRAVRAMEREPKLGEAVLASLSSNDPKVAECQREVSVVMDRIQAVAFPADFDPALQHRIARALSHVWFASLLGWVHGWVGMADTSDELSSAAHLLLDQFE